MYTGWEWPYSGPTWLNYGTPMVLAHNEHHGWNCSANPTSPGCPNTTSRQRYYSACDMGTFYQNVLHCDHDDHLHEVGRWQELIARKLELYEAIWYWLSDNLTHWSPH